MGLGSQSMGSGNGSVTEGTENETGTSGQEVQNSSLCGHCEGNADFGVLTMDLGSILTSCGQDT